MDNERPLFDVAVRHIAIVGASPRSFFMFWTLRNLLTYGFGGTVYPVHPHEAEVLGQTAYPDVDALPVVPDVAAVGIGPARCADVIARLRARGCGTFLLMSDGFAETGTPAGIALERDVVEAAAGAVLIGPNGIGVGDFHASTVALGGPLAEGLVAGDVSVVSHSGGVIAAILSGLAVDGTGVDLCISVGNGAAFDMIDALDACAERSTTSTVAAYIEGLGSDIDRLGPSLDRLAAAGKRLVVAKPGNSEAARRLVESHTAKIAGPHHVVEAMFRRHGAIVVNDLETLVRTASLASIVRPAAHGRGVAVIGSSGGSASLTSDLADRNGMRLAGYAKETEAAIAAVIPSSGTVGNPLDLSGGVTDWGEVFEAIATDDDVGALLLLQPAPFPDDTPERAPHRTYLEVASATSDRTGVPLIVTSIAQQHVPEWTAQLSCQHELVRVVQGMAPTTAALAALLGPGSDIERSATAPAAASSGAQGTALSEDEGRRVLQSIGFPVVPGEACATFDEAMVTEAAARVGFPLVAKAVLPGVAHKAAIGGVSLNLCDSGAVAAACRRMGKACRLAGADVRGFLLQEMVAGTELLVGLTRDPVYGPSMTIGLGGVLSESGIAQATDVLPLDGAHGVEALLERAGLRAVVERSAASLDMVARHLFELGEAFTSGLLSHYATVEINPLFLTHDGRVLAGDVLIQP